MDRDTCNQSIRNKLNKLRKNQSLPGGRDEEVKFPDNPTTEEKQNMKQKLFSVLSLITYHLSTEGEVITGKSQTEALMY